MATTEIDSRSQVDQPSSAAPMSHRAILKAMSGLLLGLFVALLSSTVVSNALPTILADLKGSEAQYTWIVTATLLAMTVSTPIWGKLSDLVSKKLLVQIALLIYVAGSALAGLSTSVGMLIGMRAVQGIGVGGLSALVQVVMAAIIAPRQRGRYSGYLGAVFAVATVAGPLIGGMIVDTSWLGWRWCFYVGVPFAIIAAIVLQRTLHVPTVKRQVKVDYIGATLITATATLLLVWVSFAGTEFAWLSWQTYLMVPGAILLGALFVLVESRVAEPLVPLHLFRMRTVTLSTVASLFVGVAMFGATVFLAQYFQIARGNSPTRSGLLTLPMILGLALASMIAGRIITATGRWKMFLIAGGISTTAGLGLMASMRSDTPYWQLAIYMLLLGSGVGMTMQNLVLATQNSVPMHELGAASSVVAFFRSLGGALGVSALGALLSHQVTGYVGDGLGKLGIPSGAVASGEIPDLDALPGPIRGVVESSYGHGVGDVFLVAAPFGLVALILMLFIREVALRKTNEPTPTQEPDDAAIEEMIASTREPHRVG